MDRAALWPDFRAERVVHEDEDLIVVHKPAGVSSQAAHAERPDDVVLRLRRFLRRRVTSACTSGSTATRAGCSFRASQGGQRRARGAVRGAAAEEALRRGRRGLAARASDEARLKRRARRRDERRDDARRRAAARSATPSSPSTAREAVLARTRDRALLELVLETGRTHQARVQLAHAGAPIAGDVLYGGSAAPRLMLHAGGLELDHPRVGRRASASRRPRRRRWTRGSSAANLGDGVYDDAARSRARSLSRSSGAGGSGGPRRGPRATTAFRLVNEEGDALPGLAVDVYGERLVAQIYGRGRPGPTAARRDRLLDALARARVRRRVPQGAPEAGERRSSTPGETSSRRARPCAATAAPDEIDRRRGHAARWCASATGSRRGSSSTSASTGARVREMARGAAVANLFSYTCAFSVGAALGGARRTVSVDASAAALERGRADFAHAGVARARASTRSSLRTPSPGSRGPRRRGSASISSSSILRATRRPRSAASWPRATTTSSPRRRGGRRARAGASSRACNHRGIARRSSAACSSTKGPRGRPGGRAAARTSPSRPGLPRPGRARSPHEEPPPRAAPTCKAAPAAALRFSRRTEGHDDAGRVLGCDGRLWRWCSRARGVALLARRRRHAAAEPAVTGGRRRRSARRAVGAANRAARPGPQGGERELRPPPPPPRADAAHDGGAPAASGGSQWTTPEPAPQTAPASAPSGASSASRTSAR